MRLIKTNRKSYFGTTHHGLYQQVGDGVDYADIAMGAGELAPDAAVVRAVALGLGLLDVSRLVRRGVYQ